MASVERSWQQRGHGDVIQAALAALDVVRLVLTVHEASFPAGDDDLGRGSPYSAAAHAFVGFVRALGFDGLQLGPPGLTSRDNASPYDGALFARNPLALAFGPLLPPAVLRALRADVTPASAARAEHRAACDRVTRALDALVAAPPVDAAALGRWQREAGLHDRDVASSRARDLAYERLAARHGSDDWRRWPAADTEVAAVLARGEARPVQLPADASAASAETRAAARFVLGQYLLGEEHAALRRRAAGLGLRLYGDLQIGISHRDTWSWRALFLDGYCLGAPPSRTNPDGQPWGYPVLDPALYRGPVAALVRARVGAMLADYDGLRVDHPHGWVCPWVYRDDVTDRLRAVQTGARLRAAPDLADHPALAPLAIARPDQLDRARPRWDDDWERALDDAQVDGYGALFDLVLAEAAAHGRARADLACEVLSTWPLPLRRVMARAGLGRFCVTQKADLALVDDVYRSENARPADWIMVGNHDTAPLRRLVAAWHGTALGRARAQHLAARLEPDPARRPAFIAWAIAAPQHLGLALFAELFASPARHVSVFFADLFGLAEVYNRPGTVSDDNWSLRVPADWEGAYAAALAAGWGLDLPRALALGLAAADRAAHAGLIARLLALAPPSALAPPPSLTP